MSSRRSQLAAEEPSRKTCYDCHRPEAHCLCAEVRVVENRTSLVLIQHPRERQHPFGTARLAELGLRRIEVLVDYQGRLRKDPGLGDRLAGCGLLYPHPKALDLSKLPPAQRPRKLVLLDGTWRHAHQLYRDIPCLKDLPHYSLPQGLESGFQIRKQPQSHCLSTLEAIYFALSYLEPEAVGLDEMLRPFRAMQAKQLVAMQPYSPRSKRPRQVPRGSRLPLALGDDYGSLVLVYCELSTARGEGEPRQLVVCVAERPSNGKRLRVVLKQAARDERHLEYMRLDPGNVQAGLSVDEFQAAWQDFVEPGDVLGAWNKSTLELLERELPEPLPSLVFKTLYLNLRRERGSLEEIVVAEGLMDHGELQRNRSRLSRSEERLASLMTLARGLHRLSGASQVMDHE